MDLKTETRITLPWGNLPIDPKIIRKAKVSLVIELEIDGGGRGLITPVTIRLGGDVNAMTAHHTGDASTIDLESRLSSQ